MSTDPQQPRSAAASASRGEGTGPRAERVVSCRRIQAVLFDYLTREMGAARAAFVREHLTRCAECRRAATQLERACERLRALDPGMEAPTRLSSARKRRLNRALLHPVLETLCRHHVLVSLLAALLLLAAALAWLLNWRETPPPRGIPVRIFGPEEQLTPEPAPLDWFFDDAAP